MVGVSARNPLILAAEAIADLPALDSIGTRAQRFRAFKQ
jgi:hypothetical protein